MYAPWANYCTLMLIDANCCTLMCNPLFFTINPKPLYTDSLNSWVGHIPADVEDDMAKIAPMLKTLGKTLTIFGHLSDMSRK